jgi:hypothetical protein
MNLFLKKKITLVSDRNVGDFMTYFSSYIDQSQSMIAFGWKHLPLYGLVFGNTFEMKTMRSNGRVNRLVNIKGEASPNGTGTRIDMVIYAATMAHILALFTFIPFALAFLYQLLFKFTFFTPFFILSMLMYFFVGLPVYASIENVENTLLDIVEEKI